MTHPTASSAETGGMQAPTPGPWYVEDEYVCAESAPGLGLCSVMNMDLGGDKGWFRGPITEANARLMAAAPELLTELRALLGFADGYVRAHAFEEGREPPEETFPSVRAAIAKATGATNV